jgi:hypothetical protein
MKLPGGCYNLLRCKLFQQSNRRSNVPGVSSNIGKILTWDAVCSGGEMVALAESRPRSYIRRYLFHK